MRRRSRAKLTRSSKLMGRFSLRSKIFIFFGGLFALTYVAGTLIVLYGFPGTDFRGQHGLQQEEQFQHLNLIADLKMEQLQRWIAERRGNVGVQVRDYHLADHVSRLIEVIRDERARSTDSSLVWSNVVQSSIYGDLLDRLTDLRTAYKVYGPVSIVEVASRQVIVSSQAGEVGSIVHEPFILNNEFNHGFEQTYVSDVARDEHLDMNTMHFVAAIRPQAADHSSVAPAIALLVAHVAPDDVIKPILNTGGGLGTTGEVVLVNYKREILAQLKYPLPDGSIAKSLEYQIEAMPATLAAQGKEGLVMSRDYRGVPVLAAYRHLRISTEIGWGIVVKIDEAEVFAPLKQSVMVTHVTGFFGVFFVLGAVVLISRRLSQPISRLSQVARQVEEGNLNARANATGNDEVGLLGRAFNSMVEQIQYWNQGLEQQVMARVSEVEAKNRELRVEIAARQRAQEEQRTANLRLLASEQKFRSIAERMYDVIMAADLDGIITYVSPSVTRVFGYVPEELVGRAIFDLTPASENETIRKTFALSAAGKPVEGFDSQFLVKDGTYATIEISALPIYRDNQVVGAQAIIRDMTETRRLQELESRAQRLETAGQIAGQVAHDFNNLLAPLMAYPGFIREDLPGNHPALAYLDDIESSAQKIADINQQLLALGRRGHYNQVALNLNAIIHQAVKEMGTPSETLSCEMELAEDLLPFMGGGSQIHRVVSNLLLNAVDATGDIGRITIRASNFYADDVSVAYDQVPRGEYVKLSVSDSGCGIPDEIVQKIFDPFFTSKTTDKKRGSGLGLSVVDAVVRDHGGYIDLETKVGLGTSFYVYFPASRDAAGDEHAGDIIGGRERVLVVDDDEVQRDVSSQLLTRLGYEVAVVDSGEKALEFLRESPQDILLLDMVMPSGMDGTETYRQILKVDPDQKAVIVSGFSENDRVLEVQRLGAGAFVKKPLTRRALAAAIRTELDRETKVNVSDAAVGCPV